MVWNPQDMGFFVPVPVVLLFKMVAWSIQDQWLLSCSCKQHLFQGQLESSPVFYSRRLAVGGAAWRAWEHGDCYTWLEAMSLQGFPIQAHLIYSVENKWPLGWNWWLSSQESACQAGDFDSWVGKFPWRRKWQPTPVLLPGKFHGWRSLGRASPWGRKELDMTKRLHFHVSLSVRVSTCFRS